MEYDRVKRKYKQRQKILMGNFAPFDTVYISCRDICGIFLCLFLLDVEVPLLSI